MNSKRTNLLRLTIAFLAGVAVTVIAVCVWTGLKGVPAQPADAAPQETDTTEAA